MTLVKNRVGHEAEPPAPPQNFKYTATFQTKDDPKCRGGFSLLPVTAKIIMIRGDVLG